MEGIILLLLAFALLIAEIYVPSFGILGVMGIISLLVGGHFIIEQGGIFGIPLDWTFFIGLAISLIIPMLIGSYIVAKHRNAKSVTGVEGMMGQDAKIIDWDGNTGRVHVQGELWAAHSENTYQLSLGDIVTISGIDDMSLRIRLKN